MRIEEEVSIPSKQLKEDENMRGRSRLMRRKPKKVDDSPFEYEEEMESPVVKKRRQTRSSTQQQQQQQPKPAKEQAEDQSGASDFELYGSDTNDDYCWKCKGKGQLVCCDYCYRSWHIGCAGLKRHPQGQWECPQCAPQQACTYCRRECAPAARAMEEELALAGAVMTCSKCNALMHLKCVVEEGVPIECLVDSPVNRKYFATAEMQQLVSEVLVKCEEGQRARLLSMAVQQLSEARVMFYVCVSCLQTFGVGQIVTHQRVDEGHSKSVYLTQLEQSSFVHCQYFQAATLQAVNPRKIKNYREKWEAGEEEGGLPP